MEATAAGGGGGGAAAPRGLGKVGICGAGAALVPSCGSSTCSRVCVSTAARAAAFSKPMSRAFTPPAAEALCQKVYDSSSASGSSPSRKRVGTSICSPSSALRLRRMRSDGPGGEGAMALPRLGGSGGPAASGGVGGAAGACSERSASEVKTSVRYQTRPLEMMLYTWSSGGSRCTTTCFSVGLPGASPLPAGGGAIVPASSATLAWAVWAGMRSVTPGSSRVSHGAATSRTHDGAPDG
eukprot:scaffold16424_cov61-Phaeocystis_antarctica.AAC.6